MPTFFPLIHWLIDNISNAQKVDFTPIFTVSDPGMCHMALWHKVVHSSISTGAMFWPRYAALTLLRMRAHSSLEEGQANGYWNAWSVEKRVEIIGRWMGLNSEYRYVKAKHRQKHIIFKSISVPDIYSCIYARWFIIFLPLGGSEFRCFS